MIKLKRGFFLFSLGFQVLGFQVLQLNAQNLNVAFVDMEKIFQDYHKTIQADEVIRKQTEIFKEYALNLEREREALQGEFNSLRDISQNIALSEELREQKRNEAQTKFLLLQEKEKEIQDYQKNKRSEIRKQYEEQRNKLVKEIIDYIKVVVEKENYDVVLDSSGNTLNGIPSIIYYDQGLDITEKISSRINKGYEDAIIQSSQGKNENP